MAQKRGWHLKSTAFRMDTAKNIHANILVKLCSLPLNNGDLKWKYER
jgi:hypothetical protein